MNEKLITVIVPMYNAEKYISECVDSIINQTYNNLEIIIINDGSTDKCGEICKKYANIDKRIIYIEQENKGVAETRNLALEKANGDYVFFVDSDDLIKIDTIEKLYQLVKKYNAQIAISEKEMFSNNIATDNEEIENIYVYSAKEVLRMLLNRTISSYMAGVLYNKSVIKGVKFPNYSCHEDQAVFYKIVATSENIVFTSEKMYKYRENEVSLTHTINLKKCEERFISASMLAEEIVKILPELEIEAYEFLYFVCVDILLSYKIPKDKEIYKKIVFCIKDLEAKVNIKTFSKQEKVKIYLFRINMNIARAIFKTYRILKSKIKQYEI